MAQFGAGIQQQPRHLQMQKRQPGKKMMKAVMPVCKVQTRWNNAFAMLL